MKPFSSYYLMFLTCLIAGSCTTINEDPQFSIEPVIELIEVSKDTIVQFEEGIRIKISYQDGDGDLGNPDPDINSIFIKDARLENEDEYYVGPLAPIGSEISITGSLDIQLSSTFLISNAEEETTVFSMYMVDRAGNKSNTLETQEILIVKE